MRQGTPTDPQSALSLNRAGEGISHSVTSKAQNASVGVQRENTTSPITPT